MSVRGILASHSRNALPERSELIRRFLKRASCHGPRCEIQTLITVDLVQKGPSSATNSEETGTDLPEVARVNRHGGYLATKEPI